MKGIDTTVHQQLGVRGEYADSAVGVSEDGRIQWLATGENLGEVRRERVVSVAAGEMVQSSFAGESPERLIEDEPVHLRSVSM